MLVLWPALAGFITHCLANSSTRCPATSISIVSRKYLATERTSVSYWFRLVRKIWKATFTYVISVCPSACPSTWNKSATTRRKIKITTWRKYLATEPTFVSYWFRRVRKIWKATFTYVISVCPSAFPHGKKSATTRRKIKITTCRIFMKFDIWRFLGKLLGKFKFN